MMQQYTDMELLKMSKAKRARIKFVNFFASIPGKFKNCKLSGQEYFDVINCLNRESVIISGEKLKK